MVWTQESVNEAIRLITGKATVDKAFRQLVLSDPNAAIKRATGMDVPAGFTVRVIENAPGVDQTYVLPDFKGAELSEDELERVAGGVCALKKCSAEACGADSG